MFCTKCGNQLHDGAKFCQSCGTKVEKPEAPAVPADETVAPASAPEIPAAPVAVLEKTTAPAEPSIPEVPQATSFIPQQSEAPAAPEAPQTASFIPQQSEAPAAPEAPQAASFIPQQSETPAAPEAPQAAFSIPQQPNAPAFEIPAEKQTPNAQPSGDPSKKRRILPWIIAGGAAVLVGAGALTWIFAQSSVMHMFMGDGNYAASVLDRYAAENLVQNGAVDINSVLSSSNIMPEPGEYTANELAIEVTKNIAESFSANDLGAAINVQIESGSLTDSFIGDSESAAEVLKELNGITLKGGISAGEDSVKAGLAADYGTGIFDAAVQIDSDKISIMLPSVNDTVLSTENTTTVTVPETLAEINDLQDSMADLHKSFMKYYTKADFVYESGSISIGDNEIGCTHITAEIAGEDLDDLVSDIADTLEDIYSGMGSSLSSFDAEEYDMKLLIESYVTNTNKPLGVTFTLSGKNSYGEKNSVSLASAKSDKGSYAELKLQKKTLVKLETENTSPADGTFRMDISTSTSGDDKITVKGEFSGVGTADAFGMKLPVGKLSFSLGGSAVKNMYGEINTANGDYIAMSEVLSSLKFTLEAQGADGGYKNVIGVDGGKLGGVSLTVDVQPRLGFDLPDMSNPQNEISVDSDVSMSDPAVMDYYIAVLERLDAVLSDSSVDAIGSTVLHADEIKNYTDELKSMRGRLAVYSGYNDYTISEANYYAEDIYYRTELSEFAGNDLEIIKLYFDSNGSLSIIDNCGERDEMLRSLYGTLDCTDSYAEVFVWKYRSMYYPVGVTVTRTSDPSKIPSARPDAYNLLDRIYEWQYDNISEDYAVGSCPTLMTLEKYKEYYGEGPAETAKQADERLTKTVSEFNEYADTIYTSFAQYMSKYNISTRYDDWTSTVVFNVEDGKWSCGSGYNYYFSEDIVDGDIEDAADFLSSKVSGLDNAVITVYFDNGKLCGTAVTNNSWGSYFSQIEFELGYTSSWTYLDGVQDGYAYGTYPVLNRITTDNQSEILKKFNGTWKNDDHTLTINDSTFDADKVYGFSFGYGSVTMVYRKSDNQTVYYTTDFDTYLSVEEYEDGYYENYETYYSPAEYMRRY